MEQEGLRRGLEFLGDSGQSVEILVTDRHSQVKSYMKKQHPHVKHRFDTWHVAKGKQKPLSGQACGQHTDKDSILFHSDAKFFYVCTLIPCIISLIV